MTGWRQVQRCAQFIIALLVASMWSMEVSAAIAVRAVSSAGVRTPTIAFRGYGNPASAASGNITPSLATASGSAYAQNDLLLCLVEQHDSVAVSFPAGWTQLYSISTTATQRASVFYKMSGAAGTEANPLITHAGGNAIIAQCMWFRGVDTDHPLDVAYAALYAALSTSVATPSTTTITANDMMLYALHVANNPTITVAPSGAGGVTWTQRFYNSTALGLHAAEGVYTGTKAAAGAIGPITSTISAASENHGVLMALHGGSTLSITVPAGTLAGDVMIAAIATTPSTATITSPAGGTWTPIQAVTQATGGGSRIATYYRVATAADAIAGAVYTWTLTTTHTGAAGGIVSYSGVDTTSPIDVSASAATPSSTSHTAPSITTTVANGMLVTVHEYASASSWTPPAGMTERVDQPSRAANNAGVTLEMNELLLGAPGLIAAKTATAAASADTGAAVSIALRPAVAAPHHIRIEHNGGACSGAGAPAQLTLKACANLACTAPHYTASNVTGINLAPSGGTYTWAPANPQSILAASGGINSGITLANSAIGTATLAITGTPSPAPGNAYECYNAATGTSGDCSLVFSASSFSFNVPDHTSSSSQLVTLTSCKGAFAGATRSVKFWSTYVNPATGTRQGNVVASTGNADCATGYSALGTSSGGPTTLNLSFGAGATPQTTFSLCYPDVGQVQLDARYDGSAGTGDAGTVILGSDRFIAAPHHFTLSNINCISGCTAVPNPAAASAVGAAFMKAGNPFGLTVTAYNGAGTPAVTPNFGRESTPEKVTLTPVVNMPDLPGAVAGNLLCNATQPGTTTCTTGLGIATVSDVSGAGAVNARLLYDEAGIMTLSAKLASGNYLGSGLKEITTPTSGNVGRFIPDHLDITKDPDSPIVTRSDYLPQTATTVSAAAGVGATTISVVATTGFSVGDKVRIPGAGVGGTVFTATVTAIGASSLTLSAGIGAALVGDGSEIVFDEWGSYMGERMDAQFTLTAVDFSGNITQNYQGAYAKLNPAAAGNPLGLGAVDAAGPTYSLALDTSIAASGTFAGGSAAITAPLAVVRPATEIPPYTSVKIGVAPTDSDGIKMGAYDLGVASATFDHTSIMDTLVQASTEVRHGRLRLQNANGSELLNLPMDLKLQYWSGANGWLTNSPDTRTSITTANFAFSFPVDVKNLLAACETAVTVGGSAPNYTLSLAKPGAGNSGWTDLTLNLGATASGNQCTVVGGSGGAATTANAPYLQHNWTGIVGNPTARATFGVYKSGPVIRRRENY